MMDLFKITHEQKSWIKSNYSWMHGFIPNVDGILMIVTPSLGLTDLTTNVKRDVNLPRHIASTVLLILLSDFSMWKE